MWCTYSVEPYSLGSCRHVVNLRNIQLLEFAIEASGFPIAILLVFVMKFLNATGLLLPFCLLSYSYFYVRLLKLDSTSHGAAAETIVNRTRHLK